MNIDTSTIQKLREETGAGIMDAKRALQEADGDYDGAVSNLKKQGKKIAAKKQDRKANEGVIGSYVHTNGKVAAYVALACESDFVAKTDDFKSLAHDLAMQVAATAPEYIAPEDVPEDIVKEEKAIYSEQLKKESKPKNIVDKIMTGKLEKFYSEICLLKQSYIKEDKMTIEQLIQDQVLKLGENIQIKEINRVVL